MSRWSLRSCFVLVAIICIACAIYLRFGKIAAWKVMKGDRYGHFEEVLPTEFGKRADLADWSEFRMEGWSFRCPPGFIESKSYANAGVLRRGDVIISVFRFDSADVLREGWEATKPPGHPGIEGALVEWKMLLYATTASEFRWLMDPAEFDEFRWRIESRSELFDALELEYVHGSDLVGLLQLRANAVWYEWYTDGQQGQMFFEFGEATPTREDLLWIRGVCSSVSQIRT